MPAPKIHEEVVVPLNISVAPADVPRWRAEAKARGMSLSGLIRTVMNRELGYDEAQGRRRRKKASS